MPSQAIALLIAGLLLVIIVESLPNLETPTFQRLKESKEARWTLRIFPAAFLVAGVFRIGQYVPLAQTLGGEYRDQVVSVVSSKKGEGGFDGALYTVVVRELDSPLHLARSVEAGKSMKIRRWPSHGTPRIVERID